ncbi:MAG: monovalent cation:proton antiporter-2 (CPA2) family protein [Chromatiaceae bacterium]|nr:monovalent cation:proton antiporter-2 (CPA2) family protein [Candidatus Thioaporhodococcus sediminis]
MEPKSFVDSAVILLVATAFAVAIFRRFGLGSVLGLLVAGILVGPYTPGFTVTSHVEDVRHFTELGVVLLLFIIGLEMHPHRLWSLRRSMFGLGSLQILVSGGFIALLMHLSEPDWGIDVLAGLTLALSSTAFVMQILQERGEIASPHGQTTFAILLMQDLAVVPLLALIPILGDVGTLSGDMPLFQQVLIVIVAVALVVATGYYVIPRVLDLLARQNNREAFFLVAMASVFTAAWAMEEAGMSMALGAFLMGVALSGSRYNLQIQAAIEPHKGLLMSLFFVAVGMSVDVGALAAAPLFFLGQVIAIVAIKIIVLFGLCLAFGESRQTATRVAFILSQGGEFGFVLFGAAKAMGILNDQTFILSVGIISFSMLITPLLVKVGDALAARVPVSGATPEEAYRFSLAGAETEARALVAGYGRVGHTVGTILSSSGVPYLAFDMEPARVDEFRLLGHPVYYGDVTDVDLLLAARIDKVDLVVITLDNRKAALRATRLIRDLAPHAIIVARARDLDTSFALIQAGANKAFPEAVEASLRLAAEALESLGVASEDTAMLVRGVRSTNYALVRENGDKAI